MKIYDTEGTPAATRVRTVIAGKGLDDRIDYVRIDIVSAEQKQPGYLARNPIGKVPLLELEDGLILSETTAITEYLDNLDGDPIFTGRTPRDKAVIHMMQRRVEQLVLEPIDDYFHYGTRGLGAALQPWRMADWPHRQDWGERRGRKAIEGIAYFEALLKDQPFLAGDSFTMPDITLYIALGFGQSAGLPVVEPFPTLTAWRAKVDEIPAVKDRSGQTMAAKDKERLGRA
jgi:glutathione S-transferase